MIYRDDIQKVYDLLAAPERWTKRAAARDSCDMSVSPTNTAAVKWCISGALTKVRGHESSRDPAECDAEREAVLGIEGTGDWNDRHTHEEVLALLRSAMERAPTRGAAS